MLSWIKSNRNSLIRNSFLLPILLVVIMSISHVVSWYDLGNPISWAIYLSIAIEIFALASVSASSIKMARGSIYFLFALVTAIQILGNIFYEFKDINPNGSDFLAWVELIKPLFEDWEIIDHRRFLAAIQGGTLPLMSLIALHFYIKFNDELAENESSLEDPEKQENQEESKAKSVKATTPDSLDIKDQDPEYWNELVEKLNDENENKIFDTGDPLEKSKNANKENNPKTGEYIKKRNPDHRIGKGSMKPQKNWGK